LLLPDLSAFGNGTVGIFSDYSGEGGGKYDTYSFLLCGWDYLDHFRGEMKKIRAEFKLGDKEIEFKDFGMTPIQRALPAYLDALNGYVVGLLLTVVVEKRLVSLFGPRSKSTHRALTQKLREKGFGTLKPAIAEKLFRVVHIGAYLTALLSHDGQKVFWMSDHDAICANSEAHNRMLALYQNVLGLYTERQFPLIGGAVPFKERSTDYLDLLSAADIVAGTLGRYFTDRDEVGEQNVRVKEGAGKVLVWLGHDALSLKKLCIMIRAGEENTFNYNTVEFAPKEIPDTITFLPIHLCR
jgi:hypothetical protein